MLAHRLAQAVQRADDDELSSVLRARHAQYLRNLSRTSQASSSSSPSLLPWMNDDNARVSTCPVRPPALPPCLRAEGGTPLLSLTMMQCRIEGATMLQAAGQERHASIALNEATLSAVRDSKDPLPDISALHEAWYTHQILRLPPKVLEQALSISV